MTAPADDKSTQAENERICRELLKLDSYGMPLTFTTWADAGLILEALMKAMAIQVPRLGHQLSCYRFTPEHIRSAALSYLRSLER